MKIIGISFRNNNNSLHTSDDISSEYLSIYRDGEILHEQYKAEKEPFRTGKYNIEGGLDEFFDRLENHYHIEDWKKDYSIPVCDGFSWSCTYRTEDKTDHKVKGTIEPPPMGTELVEEILDLADFAPGPWILCGYSPEYAIKKLTPYLEAFKAGRCDNYDLLERGLGDTCWKLGYTMDCFQRYEDRGYPSDYLSSECSEAELREAFKDIDYETLGTMLFSMWRGITHWWQEDVMSYHAYFQVVIELMIKHLEEWDD